MTYPLVSVIVPTYNRAHLLLKALASVRAQTYPAIQLIVVDDGSTDNTRELMQHYPDVEYHYQKNRRQAGARNTGLAHARGQYIASLDSDDTWEPDFLADSIACLEQHALDFVFLNHRRDSPEPSHLSWLAEHKWWRRYMQQPAGQWWLLSPDLVRQLFLETCPAPSSALVVRRSAMIGNWNEQMLVADDWCMVLDMVLTNPCRAAFTLRPYWVKYVQRDNVYDGREQLQTIQNLRLHDGHLLEQRFQAKLAASERQILRRQLVGSYLEYAHSLWRRDGHMSPAVRKAIRQAVELSWWQTGRHSVYMLWLYLRNQYHLRTLPPTAHTLPPSPKT